jgi:hypothetical protein
MYLMDGRVMLVVIKKSPGNGAFLLIQHVETKF